jgi:hypothetical protein
MSFKRTTVNDVKSMSLYDESGFGDKYFVLSLNHILALQSIEESFSIIRCNSNE